MIKAPQLWSRFLSYDQGSSAWTSILLKKKDG